MRLVEFLTTGKLDHSWKGSHYGFILHWCAKLREFEEVAPTNEHYNSCQKRNFFCRAVNSIPYLREIETTNELMSLNNHQLPDFDTYLEMLKSAAHRDGESHAISSNPKHCLSQHALN